MKVMAEIGYGMQEIVTMMDTYCFTMIPIPNMMLVTMIILVIQGHTQIFGDM